MSDRCESCGKPAWRYDVEWVPLCRECWLECDLTEEDETDGQG